MLVSGKRIPVLIRDDAYASWFTPVSRVTVMSSVCKQQRRELLPSVVYSSLVVLKGGVVVVEAATLLLHVCMSIRVHSMEDGGSLG